MNAEQLIEFELSRTDWAHIAVMGGPATSIPLALRELIGAQSSDEGRRAYWKLENSVVVQGQLFEAAVSVVPVILAALATLERPRFIRIGLLELLFQIVHGGSHEDEIKRGLDDLDVRCKTAAKEGLWVLYREAVVGLKEAAIEILEVIDDDDARVSFIKKAAP